MKRLLIVGCGGHGRAVAEAVELGRSFTLAGFADDSWPDKAAVWQYPILGKTLDLAILRPHAEAAIVAIGNNALRKTLCERLLEAGFELATVVHPQARVSPRATLGEGSAVMSGAIIGTEAFLGRGAIVNAGAVVDHHCRVEDYGHLGTGACMAGGSVLGAAAWIQAGSAIGYHVSIASETILWPGEARRVDA